MIKYDIVIIGAGVVGLSIAYHLAAGNKGLKIAVLEKELFPGMGTTSQCTGGIRHQFSSPVNIMLSKISLPYFKKFSSQMGYPIYFRQRGYLFLTTDPGKAASLKEMMLLLKNFDIPATILTPDEIATAYPFVKTRDLLMGTICPLDGYADPYGVTQGYLKQALSLGVQVRCSEEVTTIETKGGITCGVTTNAGQYSCPVLINASGPLLHRLGAMAGLKIPASPYRRQVYVCSPVKEIPPQIPLLVDLDTGFYIHAEKSGTMLLGGTDRNTYPGLNTDVDWRQLDKFTDAAIGRVPALEQGGLVKAYVGIRSLTPDYHGILGEAPELKGYFIAGGFGGSGFMHSPAIGLLASQLILEGKSNFMYMSALSPDRFNKDCTNETNVF